MFEFQKKEIERIGRLITDGRIDSLRVAQGGGYGGLFAYRKQLKNRLIEIMTRLGNFGRGQVNAEIKRQVG